ncbi:hypothetical protein ASPBRDRAFT_543120 [Aspergillus brasiliensis CBS 101740]|uniref:Peptidase C14 caspase domain-containing protein n=1 Tax=Aspergillus brasiliensis (strain CBS 101740 / IMI 381727 / IBT 21946) TaxID=767769 RepID=A0A1L9ULC0_ASPBC|nr:hypothetical protein ASPBRDRAFT_543120 [Aspergillus brasiliensis CBS 101740]
MRQIRPDRRGIRWVLAILRDKKSGRGDYLLGVQHGICYPPTVASLDQYEEVFDYHFIAMPTTTSRFLLIGVDFYQPAVHVDHDFKGGNLKGCVQDVTALDNYLQSTLHIPPHQIRKFTSSTPPEGATEPVEAPELRASTANIIGALKAILTECKSGDQVFIHYSGHGGRAPTLWPKVKGERAHDESLIPCDIRCGGNFLRDVELGWLLHQMTEAGLMVTIVLDCCYSGGATRGDDEEEGTSREFEEFRDLPLDLMKTPIELQQLFTHSDFYAANEKKMTDWLEQPQHYERFAACRANQKALEQGGRGVLSKVMLEALQSAGTSPPTYGMLFRRIMSGMKSLPMKLQQNPEFSGNQRRVFLRFQESPDVASIPVTEEHFYGATYIRLEAGSVMGMVEDAEFLVYPWDAVEFTESNAVARLKIYRVQPLACYARDVNKSGVEYSRGYQAVQCKYPVDSTIKVRLVGSLAHDSKAIDEVDKCCFATIAKTQNAFCNYTLSSDSNQYIIKDGNNRTIENVPSFPDVASLLTGVYRLAKYSTLKEVKNEKWTADCPSALKFEFGLDRSHALDSSGTYTFIEGSDFNFRFKNNSEEELNLVILNFRPLFGIRQVYPADGASCGWVDPDSNMVDPPFRPITLTIKHDVPVIEDEFKAFVSTKPLDFSFMQQPNIDHPSLDEAGNHKTTRGEKGIFEIWDRSSDMFRGSDSEIGDWDTATIRIVTKERSTKDVQQ